jgi:hypothetical protein
MKKEKVLKVYGGRYYGREFREGNSPTRRMVIAAYTKKQAMELGEVSAYEFKEYFCETGNDYEKSLATEVGVWILDDYRPTKLLGRWK